MPRFEWCSPLPQHERGNSKALDICNALLQLHCHPQDFDFPEQKSLSTGLLLQLLQVSLIHI